MDDPSDRLINTFGALSQAVSDRVRMAIAGAVRVVERLGDQGLVEKSQSSSDRRVVHVTLTLQGQAQRAELLGLRKAAVAALLGKVSAEDRVALERAADAILSSVFCDPQGGWATCRLCDHARCDDCPVDRHRP